MDYKRIYDDLMQSRLLLKEDRIKLRRGGDYFEAHHIIPKSMGGEGTTKNVKHANMILLTGREHYLAHALLFLVYRNREMARAFWAMSTIKTSAKRKYVISSRMYEYIRQEINRLGVSPETREKISHARLGRKQSPEHIEKRRQAKLGKKMSLESREKIRQAILGKKHLPKTREKIRQAKLGKKMSLESREKMRQAKLGKKMSLESREKMRETRKRNRLLKLAQLNGDGVQGG